MNKDKLSRCAAIAVLSAFSLAVFAWMIWTVKEIAAVWAINSRPMVEACAIVLVATLLYFGVAKLTKWALKTLER